MKQLFDQFNTKLNEKQEKAFQDWLVEESMKRRRDVSLDLVNYDLRGYWLSGGADGAAHMPDTYKKPNHPTFSNESIYHGQKDSDGKLFEGGQWADGKFVPGKTNLDQWGTGKLQEYFKLYEPDVILDLRGVNK